MRLWCLLRRDTGYNVFVANPQQGRGWTDGNSFMDKGLMTIYVRKA